MKDYLAYLVEDFVTDESYLRYYFKENEADIQFWTDWISRHPEKLDVIISANNYIEAFSIRLSDAEFQKEQQRFAGALKNLSEHGNTNLFQQTEVVNDHDYLEETEIISVSPLQRMVRKAIIFSMAVVLLGGVYFSFFRNSKVSKVSTATENIVMVEKYVPKGEQARILLPDGSEVHLNADSRLVYPSKFTGGQREVTLTGEAFFHVKRDTLHPFHIISGNLMTTVLGTSFNVKCYQGDQQIKVALVTGKVKLDRIADSTSKKVIGETMFLNPSEMGLFSKRSLALQKKKYNPDEELGWERGIIVFKNADFKEIADRFQRTFNIHLVNRSHKKQWSFTGSFSNASAVEIVESICLSKKLTYTTNGDTIVIK
ncbi:FecR domain-containing protein [Chitinophagaceae bacterium LB-8]|uniref:FecR domain-containing protein n=1 Tax=Paraflavisolibacter caeni TaxID=2982496 RepID=A0A9X2XW12_9BACT|nr:FecR family protein [Paraflavisolibacter caeni]MCU7550080.1 FecR domain-containing protein [Paraflavisolibacter caeni]